MYQIRIVVTVKGKCVRAELYNVTVKGECVRAELYNVTVKGECVRAEFKARFKNSGALVQNFHFLFHKCCNPHRPYH